MLFLRISILTLFFFSFILFGSHQEAVQSQKLEPQEQHETVVTLKLVQVFVTGSEGRPVLDLTKADFELYEDGVLKTITDFEKHPLKKKTEEISLGETPISSASLNRKFFIFLDIFGSDRIGISQAREAALHFIDTQLRPDDEVAVITYQYMSGFNVKQYLTKDYEKIRRAVKNARELPPGGDYYDYDLMNEQKRAEQEAGLEEDRWAFGSIDRPLLVAGLNRLARNSEDFTDEVTEVGKALRYIPGQKNIILFSGGRFRKAEEMGREFAASNSPVFAVNTVKPSIPDSPSPLKTLSEISGGKYFQDVEDAEAIAKNIQSLTINYYVLGYYVDENWDGSFHKIDVMVKREGCRVHCQEGYYNPRPFSEYTDTEKELHLIDLAAGDNPVLQSPLRLPLLPVVYPHPVKSYLLLLTELGSDELIRYFSGKTDVMNLIFDEEGDIVDSSRGEVDLSGLGDKHLFHYSVHFLAPGRYKSRFVLRNMETGKGAVAQASVDIPEWKDFRLRFYPPLLLIPDSNAEYIKYFKKQKKLTLETLPSLNEIFPFISNRYSALIQDIDADTARIHAVLRYSVQDIEAPDVLLTTELIQKITGEKRLLGANILSAKEDKGTIVMLVEIKLSGLDLGDYSLNFILEEEITGMKAEVSRMIKVR